MCNSKATIADVIVFSIPDLCLRVGTVRYSGQRYVRVNLLSSAVTTDHHVTVTVSQLRNSQANPYTSKTKVCLQCMCMHVRFINELLRNLYRLILFIGRQYIQKEIQIRFSRKVIILENRSLIMTIHIDNAVNINQKRIKQTRPVHVYV